jgi:hypothetical protein
MANRLDSTRSRYQQHTLTCSMSNSPYGRNGLHEDFLKLHVVAPNPTTQQAPVALHNPTQPRTLSAAHDPNPTQPHASGAAHKATQPHTPNAAHEPNSTQPRTPSATQPHAPSAAHEPMANLTQLNRTHLVLHTNQPKRMHLVLRPNQPSTIRGSDLK